MSLNISSDVLTLTATSWDSTTFLILKIYNYCLRLRKQSVLVQLNLVDIVILSSKHKLFIHLVSLVRSFFNSVRLFTFLLHFFNSVCISKRVEGVLNTSVGRAYICNHRGFRVACEGVF